ncbi:TPA: type IV pilus modification PilV family protein, partial [Legionella anisa]
MNHSGKYSTQQTGMSLIEVLVAFVILAVGLLGIA